MRQTARSWQVWGTILAVAAIVAAALISLMVLGVQKSSALTATSFSDVIRFEAKGVASLELRIFNLAGQDLWSSGVVSGTTVDWDRTSDSGDTLACGVYIYAATGWNSQGGLLLDMKGRVALLPGDQVQLQTSSLPSTLGSSATDEYRPSGAGSTGIRPKAVDQDHSSETWAFKQVGVGTTSPNRMVTINSGPTGSAAIQFYNRGAYAWHMGPFNSLNIFTLAQTGIYDYLMIDCRASNDPASIQLLHSNVCIGTDTAGAKLTIEDSSGQNLIAAYNNSFRGAGAAVFVVKNNGEVRADGEVYAASFSTGSADVAERVNTSEWVEAGDVVEIDADHPGFFRKSSELYSRRVAGIISTSPGVILGNDIDPKTDDWDDSRPVLAIAGRVPVKVSTENGAIAVGDLLVSSSKPGVAMRGDASLSVGAVVGKAMEPLNEGEGEIVAQVMLR